MGVEDKKISTDKKLEGKSEFSMVELSYSFCLLLRLVFKMAMVICTSCFFLKIN